MGGPFLDMVDDSPLLVVLLFSLIDGCTATLALYDNTCLQIMSGMPQDTKAILGGEDQQLATCQLLVTMSRDTWIIILK